MMKKQLKIGLSIAALALAGGGAAYAQQGMGGHMGAKMDLDGNGVVTRSEAQSHAAQMFATMDSNKDGKLDQTDREAHRAERRTKMFDRLDANHDGQISRDEFSSARHDWHGKRGDGDGDDRGKDGRWGRKGGHHGGPEMMMRMADTNKDGAVSQAEFTAAAMGHFDRMDANHDGKVTQEERQAAHEAMRAKWKDMRDQRAQNTPDT